MGNGVARTVGRYEILEELGRGGMATVYLARQTDLDRLVALKELSTFRQSDPAFTRRFLRESRVAGSLSHPNIVTVHDYFESEGAPYIAMEYVSCGSLRPHIGHLPLTQVAGVLEGILAALGHAEQHDIVHRDLKPENVMVTADGRVKLTDFGIAKATGQSFRGSFLTAAGSTVGTPSYMAPEQAMGQEVGPWTDLYSVGVMAFEMFVGEVPFHDTEEPMAVLMRQVSDPIPPASSLNPEVDEAISGWIERLLVKEPEHRLQSAGEAWDQFEEIVLALVGPRWRRSARLPALATAATIPRSTVPTVAEGHATSEASTRRVGDRGDAALAPTVMPTQPRDEDPQRREHPRARRRAALVKAGVALMATLVALAAAFGNRGAGPGGSPHAAARTTMAPPTITISGRELALKVPRGWSRMGRPPDIGLPLSRAVAVAQRPGSALPVIEFGVMKGNKASNSTLLPAAFLSAIGQPAGTAPSRTAVRLPSWRLEAWRYRNLRPAGSDRQLTVYAVPTTGGVATVACAVAPAQADAFEAQCAAVAGSLELRHARGYPVGPSATYASTLNATTANLQQATRTQEAALMAARTLAAQAAAARTLAESYATAGAQLAELDLSPADEDANRRLFTALRSLGKAYGRVARAATAGDASRYRAVSAAIPAAKARVNAAMAGVRAAGYQPAAGARPAAPAGSRPAPSAKAPPSSTTHASDPDSDVGDSRSDDPSDDEDDDEDEP